MFKHVLLLFLLVASFTGTASAQYERAGSSSAQFLNLEVSPRAAALSGSYISLAQGAEGVYYNSGALAKIEGTDAAISHTVWFAGINHNFISVAKTISPMVGTFAFSATGLYTDEMIVRTPLQPEGTGEKFMASNHRFGLSYSRKMSDYVAFGGTVNYIHMQLYEGFTSQAFSFDLGVLYTSDFRDFSFGMQISNFGSDINFYKEAYPMPTYFVFGGHINAYESETVNVLLTATAKKPNDGSPQAAVGTEISILNQFDLRFGSKLNHSVESYSTGLGYRFSVQEYIFGFNYSWSSFSDLGIAHRIGCSLRF